VRSPNYPAFGLTEAVDAVKALWEKEKKTPVDVATIATAWGYGSVSGRVRSKLGAVRKFGLVEDTADGIRVSAIAMRILHEADNTERLTAMREAALKPSLFRELYESHANASDQAIKSYLILKRGFSDAGAREATRAFRDTIEVANLVGSEYTPQSNTSDDSEDDMRTEPTKDVSYLDQDRWQPHLNVMAGQRPRMGVDSGAGGFNRPNEHPVGDSIPVSQDCKMSVWASGSVTQTGVDKLIKYLELIKDSFPKDLPKVEENHMA
jgi:hypothetical protein